MSNSGISILMPVYDDWDSLAILLRQIDEVSGHLPEPVAVYIIDDHSRHGISGLSPTFSFRSIRQVDCIRLARNVGHQAAIAAGLCHLRDRGTTGRVVIMDADGEDNPGDIPQLISRAAERDDGCIIFAARRRRNASLGFRGLYFVYKQLQYALTGRFIDFGNFSVIPGALLCTLTLYDELWQHYPGTVLISKLPYSTVPCDRRPRIGGRSKMSLVQLVLHGLKSISICANVVAVRILLAVLSSMLLPTAALVVVIGIRGFTELAIPGWATYSTGLLLVLLLHLFSLSALLTFITLSSQSSPFSRLSDAYMRMVESENTVYLADDHN